jgi:hypothetical protein|tara:strand:- start:34558 stop:34734 length:177 start_codon:yes stop_codon:yes gene_type:complete
MPTYFEELVAERERNEVLTENVGNCMDTIAQQDKEIERLEDVIKVLSRLLAEENGDTL